MTYDNKNRLKKQKEKLGNYISVFGKEIKNMYKKGYSLQDIHKKTKITLYDLHLIFEKLKIEKRSFKEQLNTQITLKKISNLGKSIWKNPIKREKILRGLNRPSVKKKKSIS